MCGGPLSNKEETKKLTVVSKCIDFCRIHFNPGDLQNNRLELP